MKIQKLNSHPDLSKAKGSTTQIISDNVDKISACSSKEELINLLENDLFKGMTAPGASKIILRVKKAYNFNSALKVVFDSMLAGENLETIK